MSMWVRLALAISFGFGWATSNLKKRSEALKSVEFDHTERSDALKSVRFDRSERSDALKKVYGQERATS